MSRSFCFNEKILHADRLPVKQPVCLGGCLVILTKQQTANIGRPHALRERLECTCLVNGAKLFAKSAGSFDRGRAAMQDCIDNKGETN
jgi:hypothetical protein